MKKPPRYSPAAFPFALLSVSAPLLFGACHPAPRPGIGPVAGAAVEAAPPPLVGHNVLYNESFNQGTRALPWTGQISTPAEGRTYVDKGELCMEVKNRGLARWDAQLRQQHVHLQKGHTYQVQFKMHSTQKTRVYLKLGQAGPPYREFWKLLFETAAADKAQVFSGKFTMQSPDDPGVELAFHLGGQLSRTTPAPFTVCIDDAHIDDPEYVQTPEVRRLRSPRCWSTSSATSRRSRSSRPSRTRTRSPGRSRTRPARRWRPGRRSRSGSTPPRATACSIADFTAFADQGQRLHAARGRRHQPPVRHPRRSLREAEVRRARVLLSPAQRRPDRDALRGRGAVGAPGRPRRRQAERRRRQRAVRDRQRAATTRSTSRAAGTTRAITASTWSTAASPSGRCSTSTSATLALGTSAEGLRRRQDEHPGEQERRSRPARRGALGARVRCSRCRCPTGKPLAGMVHHKVHDQKWTELATAPARGPDAALPAAAEHGRDAEPGRHRGAGGAHLEDARHGVRRQVPQVARSRHGSRPRRTRRSSRPRGARAAAPTMTASWATISTGRRRSSTSPPASPSTGTSPPSRSTSRR